MSDYSKRLCGIKKSNSEAYEVSKLQPGEASKQKQCFSFCQDGTHEHGNY